MRSSARSFLLRLALPLLVLTLSAVAAWQIFGNRPDVSFQPERATRPGVDAQRVTPSDYPVVIRSQGVVRPSRSNTLVSEVAGRVVELSAAFVVGGDVEAGDVLVELDRRDYEIALTRARATLAQAEAGLQEQAALAELARVEWQQLGGRGEPSPLTLRTPQLAAARAERDAAAAEKDRAEVDLERTRIVAPYAGRVLSRAIDGGEFLSRGALVGRIHGIDSVDVVLPLSSRQQTWLQPPTASSRPNVEVMSVRGGRERRWTGKLIRIEGIDEATRQLTVVARIDAPWADPEAPLRVGEYVEALIAGQVLEAVFVIPRIALRDTDEVLIVDDAGTVHRQAVVVAWSDDEVAAVTDGLAEGDILVLTPLSTVVDGTPVRATIDGVAPPPLEPEA